MGSGGGGGAGKAGKVDYESFRRKPTRGRARPLPVCSNYANACTSCCRPPPPNASTPRYQNSDCTPPSPLSLAKVSLPTRVTSTCRMLMCSAGCRDRIKGTSCPSQPGAPTQHTGMYKIIPIITGGRHQSTTVGEDTLGDCTATRTCDLLCRANLVHEELHQSRNVPVAVHHEQRAFILYCAGRPDSLTARAGRNEKHPAMAQARNHARKP